MVVGTVHESMKAEVHLEGEGTCPDLLCRVQQRLLKRRPIAASALIFIQDSTTPPAASHQRWLNIPSTGKNFLWLQQPILIRNYPSDYLSRSTLEGLAEEKKLGLVIDRQYTGTGNTT